VSLDLPITNLAHGDRNRSGNDLRLTICENGDDGGSNHSGTDDLAVALLSNCSSGSASQDVDVDWRTLSRPVAVVQVVEGTREALVEGGRTAKCERAVSADREARGEDSAGLRGTVELELEVGGDVTSATEGVEEDAIGQGENQNTLTSAVSALLFFLVSSIHDN
jgi:hypothetical protein